MSNARDWRLGFQGEALRGETFARKVWSQTRPDWDHDHCAFCWAKFGPDSMPDVLREGFATSDDFDWVCPTCFDDFKDELQLKVAT